MEQKKEKVVSKGKDNSPEHVLKLLGRVGTELSTSTYDSNSRRIMRDMFEKLPKFLDKMDEQDEKYQNLPEIRIPQLKEEIKKNDEVLRKNHEETDKQIQVGLYQKGYPPASPMYHSVIERMKLDKEDAEIKLKSDFQVLNPVFLFQSDSRWRGIQKEYHKRNIKAIIENLAELEKQVGEVKIDIEKQNQRINLRRIQIVEELKKAGEDVSEYIGKVPEYIG